MKVIYKYQFPIEDDVLLSLPRDAVILHIDNQIGQYEDATAWALVDTDVTTVEPQRFRIYGTGQQLPDDIDPADHVTTWQAGPFVWHLFRDPNH